MKIKVFFIGLLFLFWGYGKKSAINMNLSRAGGKVYSFDFENVKEGTIPDGWVVESTRKHGKDATWMVMKDKSAPSGTHVFGIKKINHNSASTFNLAWTGKIQFLNGEIEVKFKAISGKIDEGGGIMWRVQDKNNYYVARFNPLEDNFRIYHVINAKRTLIKSYNIKLAKDKWHTMKIVQKNDSFECYLNGKKLLSGSDGHIKKAGGVGLWTKADALTHFDDFKVTLFKSK